jgi:hypothetical protein
MAPTDERAKQQVQEAHSTGTQLPVMLLCANPFSSTAQLMFASPHGSTLHTYQAHTLINSAPPSAPCTTPHPQCAEAAGAGWHLTPRLELQDQIVL